MSSKGAHPLAHFHERITDVTSRFSFTHHPVPDSSGLIVSPQGFARPFYHKPTNTIGVLFSKTANNLDGIKQDDGRIIADVEQLKRCYIFGARRLKGDPNDSLKERPNSHTVKRELREDMDVARRSLGIKSRKHYTLYGGDNIFTNGRHMYEIEQMKNGQYRVLLRLSTRRKNGGFVPFDMNDKSLRGVFSRATTTIAKTHSYKEAREVISHHWAQLSADLWENRNVFVANGKKMMAKKMLSDFANVVLDKGGRIAAATAIVGGLFSIKYGITLGFLSGLATGFTGTLVHTAVHLPIELGVDEYSDARRRSKELKSKQQIDKFSYDVDVSDHFKIQTAENLAKLCPHLDFDRFKAEDFEFLPLELFDLRKDREQLQDNLQAVSLAGHLMFMGQRGISSEAYVPDSKSEVRAFQSGVARFMHEKDDGRVVVYAQYRPELCLVDELRLPQQYIDQFEGQIVRMEYDRTKETFADGLISPPEAVSYQGMMAEIERDILFSSQKDISWETHSKSMQGLYSTFADTGSFSNSLAGQQAYAASMRAVAI